MDNPNKLYMEPTGESMRYNAPKIGNQIVEVHICHGDSARFPGEYFVIIRHISFAGSFVTDDFGQLVKV